MSEVGERFTMATPVTDSLAEDEAALAAVEADCRGAGWADFVARSGGRALDPPSLRREPNPHYGQPFYDENGEVMLNEAGEPVLDIVKFHIIATGRAVRVEGR